MILEVSSGEIKGYIEQKLPVLILDIREQSEFMGGHVRGSANARCSNMQQKQVIMSKIPRNFKIILIDADGSESSQNAAMMAKFGFDAHFLDGGMNGWDGELEKSTQDTSISNDDLWKKIQDDDSVFLLDVREPQEFAEFKIPGAVNVPLSQLFASPPQDIPAGKKIITICSHGNRSMIATFALAKSGLESTSLEGGMAGWNQVLVPTVAVKEDELVIIQVEKVGKGCLSHIVASQGQAIVIDATYPATRFVEIAQKEGLKIIGVADTHQHADHVSAAKELAGITGSQLYLSGTEQYSMQNKPLSEGDVVDFGSKQLRVMHTPGHTAGSMTYVVDNYVFSGDTLFMEGIGRPDLRDKAEEFAGNLYDTIHGKILKLPTDAMIFPTHHSNYTKPAGDGTYHTDVESAKKMPLLDLDRQQFVQKVVSITTPRPMNYSMIININKGSMPVMPGQIPDLEMGPNRCSIKTQ